MIRKSRLNPTLGTADAAKRLPLLRRAMPPIQDTLGQGLSGESFTPGITCTTTTPTITNPTAIAYADFPTLITAHGAQLTFSASFNYFLNMINGSTTRAAYALGLEYQGSHVYFKFRSVTTTAHYWVFIDDKPVTAAPVAVVTTAGTDYCIDLPFTSSGSRRIKVWTAYMDFRGFFCSKTDGYGPTPPAPFSILWWGDSWIQGAGSIFLDHYPLKVSRALGADAYLCGQGGTGYLAPGPGSGSSVYGSADRFAGVATLKPDLIVVAGSVNDRGYAVDVPTLQAPATVFFAQMAAQFPRVPIIVQGTQAISSGAGFASAHNISKTGVLNAARANPAVIGTIDPRFEGWINGSGSSTAPASDGNADTFITTDFIHLTAAGNEHYARRTIAKIASILATA